MTNQQEPTQQSTQATPPPDPEPQREPSAHEQAALSVMHPDSYDADWRYYHGAWG